MTAPSAVLVTGGAGYIGSHACKALAARGIVPVVYDNLSTGSRAAVKWGPLVVADLLDHEALVAAFRSHPIRAVMHFAAGIDVADSLRAPATYYAANVVGTLNLLDAMRATGVSAIVYSSSCALYGLPDRIPVDEDHPARPLTPYGQTKLDAEGMLRWYGHAYGLRWIALRYFNAAGSDPGGEIGEAWATASRLIPRAIAAALGRGPALAVYGIDWPTPDGTAIRDYVHVSDLAEAHVAALQAIERPAEPVASQALNLGTGRGVSVLEVIAAIEQLSGAPLPRRLEPRRAGDAGEVVADARRAAKVLGWAPRHSNLEQIIRTAWAWATAAGTGDRLS
jgi:UDP-arabinose 4-epimerase